MNKKTILITGSRGFVGSSLVKKLIDQNEYKIIEFDIQDGDVATHKFKLEKIDHVIHLAGKTYVPDSWENPYSFYKTNFLGTANILELCREHKASITHISAYVYGEPNYLPINEEHPLNGANPYMHSKINAESVCRFYAENYNVPTTIIRPFNLYGPNQSDHFLIPKIIKQVLSEDDVISVFSLSSKRDYIYIDDMIDALIKCLELKSDYQAINIGSGISYSTKEIIDFCQNIAGTNKKVVSENIERKNEILDVVADVSKASEILLWKPHTSIEKGLTNIINHGRL
ncbi:GDP-6-deoxy-D-mannose reductase [subsurface metagenome]